MVEERKCYCDDHKFNSSKIAANCISVEKMKEKVIALELKMTDDRSDIKHMEIALNTLVEELKSIRKLMYGVSITVVMSVAAAVLREFMK